MAVFRFNNKVAFVDVCVARRAAAPALTFSSPTVVRYETRCQTMVTEGVWHAQGDVNLNNVYHLWHDELSTMER